VPEKADAVAKVKIAEILNDEDIAHNMPFRDEQFDCVFSCASFREWANPRQILDEIAMVLMPNGRYYIVDLRRCISNFIKQIVSLIMPGNIRPYFLSSVELLHY
jgi:ubiquinone/menaquinone biosynthesis C-methylase UbiE